MWNWVKSLFRSEGYRADPLPPIVVNKPEAKPTPVGSELSEAKVAERRAVPFPTRRYSGSEIRKANKPSTSSVRRRESAPVSDYTAPYLPPYSSPYSSFDSTPSSSYDFGSSSSSSYDSGSSSSSSDSFSSGGGDFGGGGSSGDY